MNPKAQRIAIAESVGIYLHDGDHAPSGYMFVDDLPDYLNDLNAMHEAEKVLTDVQCLFFRTHLRERLENHPASLYVWHATARQRAEAYLKTIGKWEGGHQ